MNIREAFGFSTMQQRSPSSGIQEKRTAMEITSRIFSLAEESGAPFRGQSEQDWDEEWLVSRNFFLIDLPTHLASVPKQPEDSSKVLASMAASGGAIEPIVVDLNKKKIGMQGNGKYFPPVIVVDGRHRHRGVQLQGRERVKAWVGELAAAYLGLLEADHQMGSKELHTKLYKLLEAEHNQGDGITPVPYDKRASIEEVFPVENYFVFTKDDKKYRQTYKCNDRDVELTGKPKEVVSKYVNASAEKKTVRRQVSPMEQSMQIFASVPIKACDKGMKGHGAGGMGGPGSSLGNGSGPAPNMKPAKMAAEEGGYKGYSSASKVMSDKTKGASGSELAGKLKGSGYYGYKDATETQSNKTKGGSKSEMVSKLKGSAVIKKIITRYKKALKGGYIHAERELMGVAPPGMEHVVKSLKKHFKPGSASPYKLSWFLHNKKAGKG